MGESGRVAARPWIGPAALLLLVVCAYLPHLGRGFLKDDFDWIAGSRFAGAQGLIDLFSRQNGFYRPVVNLTFALNQRLFGLEPFGYGLTNLALVLCCIAAIATLGRALGMPPAAAWMAAALWGLNPHGVGGAVMWISGRTSLLAVLFSVLAAAAHLRGRRAAAAGLCLLALLSKEEAVAIPLVLVVWTALERPREARAHRKEILRAALLFSLPLIVYFLLRLRTAAFYIWTAPSYYTFTFAPGLVLRNLAEYVDRTSTLAAVCVVVVWLAAGRIFRLSPTERGWAEKGMVWLAATLVMPLLLPVRSSLYALLPAVGSALCAAALLHASWQGMRPARRRTLLLAAPLVAIALLPVYWSRNVRLMRQAQLSRQVLAELSRARADVEAASTVVSIDDPTQKVNLANTFGTLVQEAVRLTMGVANAAVWVEPPLPNWAEAGLRRPAGRTITFRLVRDRLVQQDAPGLQPADRGTRPQ
jgi:hypothetical protein